MIREFSISFSRTFNLGNYESIRVEASVTVAVNEGGDLALLKEQAQADLKTLLQETYKAQFKTREGGQP